MIKLEITENEYELIKDMLETCYYLAKSDMDDELMEEITEFEEKFMKIKVDE